MCGINVRRVRILIFTLSGLLAAVTGILLAARLGSGNAGAANGLEFDVIAAVVVGGTALSGGRVPVRYIAWCAGDYANR